MKPESRARIALTHAPSADLAAAELTFLLRRPIDVAGARTQHATYVDLLRRHGYQVTTLAAHAGFPDAVFIEDTAVVLDELAVLCTPGSASRRGEVVRVVPQLARYRPTVGLAGPATLEGGDVLRIGKTLFVGRSTRTNEAGLAGLRELVEPHGYTVVPVTVTGCLHLKTAVCALDEQTVLMNRTWIDPQPFAAYRILDVAKGEPWAANVLRLDGTIVLHAGWERTAAMLAAAGYTVETLDIAEFLKAEAGLTCMSLLFENGGNDA